MSQSSQTIEWRWPQSTRRSLVSAYRSVSIQYATYQIFGPCFRPPKVPRRYRISSRFANCSFWLLRAKSAIVKFTQDGAWYEHVVRSADVFANGWLAVNQSNDDVCIEDKPTIHRRRFSRSPLRLLAACPRDHHARWSRQFLAAPCQEFLASTKQQAIAPFQQPAIDPACQAGRGSSKSHFKLESRGP